MNCLKLYCVYDDQFHIFSEPFCAADDNAAERILVQSSIVSEEFRKRLCFHSLHCIGSFDPSLKCPATVLKRPRLVSGSVRLNELVEAVEAANCHRSFQKSHLATSSPFDFDVKEDTSDEKSHSEILQCFDPT